MKLLHTYALATGSTIDKPFIFENFFPIPFEKYITFQAQTKYTSKDYSYWQDVLNIIFPVLDKLGIKIIQIGIASEYNYRYCVDLRGKTDFGQLAYVINKSMLHLGSDSLGVHMASAYDIPIVGLYSVSQSEVSGPHFGDKNKQILFDAFLRTRTGKPSYQDKESPKCVDLIKPEEIASAIFKLLNIDVVVPFETVFIGEKYGPRIVRELIPTKAINISNPESPVEIRMDLNFDEKILAQQLSFSKGIVITDKAIDKNLLKQFRQNIVALVYDIKTNDDPSFIQDIKDIGLNIYFITSIPEDELVKKKINYYEIGKINALKIETEDTVSKLKKDMDKLWFRSNKIVLQDDKAYMSNVGRIEGQQCPNDFEFVKAKDCPEFWKELVFMNIVKRIDKVEKIS